MPKNCTFLSFWIVDSCHIYRDMRALWRHMVPRQARNCFLADIANSVLPNSLWIKNLSFHLYHLLDILLVVLADVVQEFFALEDFDVGGANNSSRDMILWLISAFKLQFLLTSYFDYFNSVRNFTRSASVG